MVPFSSCFHFFFFHVVFCMDARKICCTILGRSPVSRQRKALPGELLGEDLGLVSQRPNEENVGVHSWIRLQDAGQSTRRDPIPLHVGITDHQHKVVVAGLLDNVFDSCNNPTTILVSCFCLYLSFFFLPDLSECPRGCGRQTCKTVCGH